jgi:hypothetical protein
MSPDRDILESLDEAVHSPRAEAVLSALALEVSAILKSDPAAHLAWRSVPLDTYGTLPSGIASSWVFALRAGCSSGAERHPNSIQRVMSYRGAADMRIWNGQGWVSNVLTSSRTEPLESRWLSIPVNVWHRPVMGDADWVVVSFHTAADGELIEELAVDDEHPNHGSGDRRLYAGRRAR